MVGLDEKPVTLHARHSPPRDMDPGGITNTGAAAWPVCSVPSSRKPVGTLPSLYPISRHMNSPTWPASWRCRYPEAATIQLVMDNLNIHCRKSLTDVFGMETGAEIWDRFTVHFTPVHSSLLNQAEIEIGLFSRQCLGHRRIADLQPEPPPFRLSSRRGSSVPSHSCPSRTPRGA